MIFRTFIYILLSLFLSIGIEAQEDVKPLPAEQNDNLIIQTYISNTNFKNCETAITSLDPDWKNTNNDLLTIKETHPKVWVKKIIENTEQEPVNKFILFYWKDPGKIKICEKKDNAWKFVSPLNKTHAHSWTSKFNFPLFELTLEKQEKKSFIFLLESDSRIKIPVLLTDEESLSELFQFASDLLWLFIGSISIISIYNLFLLFYYKDTIYIYFLCSLICIAFSIFLSFGQSIFVYPSLFILNRIKAEYIFFGIAGFGAIQFSRKYLDTYENFPLMDGILKIMSSLHLLLPFFSYFHEMNGFLPLLFSLVSAFGVLFILLAGFKSVKNDFEPAEWFLYGWIIFTILGTFFILYYLHILPFNFFVVFSLLLLIPLDFLILNISIFIRRKFIEKENNNAGDTLTLSDVKSNPVQNRAKYEKSYIQGLDIEKITLKLKELMEKEKAYLDEDLRSGDLAAMLRITPHQFSEILSIVLNTNFHRLVQEYRIKEAMRLISENPDKNILDIGYEVGFQSKSTFNLAFKKFTGMTPMEFRQGKNQVMN